MKGAEAAPWPRLALLVLAVLGAHLVLLAPQVRHFYPSREEPVRHFMARTVPASPPTPARTPEPPAANRPPPELQAAPLTRAAPARAQKPAAPAHQPPPVAAHALPVAAPQPAGRVIADPDAEAAALANNVLALPVPATMHYQVVLTARGMVVQGEARLDWRHDGREYEAQLEISSPGLRSRVQRSMGRITDRGLEPSYFSERSRSELATHFDREKQRLVFSNNSPQAALGEGMQDRLSVVVQLSMLVADHPADFTPGTQVTLPTAGTREAEDWTFSVEGDEELQLPGGTLRALKLQRLPRREYDQKVELWLAPSLDYAPVRLRLTNPNGDGVDQRWSSTDRS